MPGIPKQPQTVSTPIVTGKSSGSKQPIANGGATHAFLRDTDGRQEKGGKSPCSTEEEEPADEDLVEPFEPQVEFKPVVQLTQLVKPPTETDTDLVLFETRAKSYRAQTNPDSHAVTEWKERGTGTFRLLMCRTSAKVRVVMRREGTLKVCLNHYLSPEIPWQFAFNSTTAVTWYTPAEASDSERPPEHAVLALRVKTEENIKELLAKVNECRAWNGKVAAGKEKSGSPRAPKPIEREGVAPKQAPVGRGQSMAAEPVTQRMDYQEQQDEEQAEDYEPKAHFEPVIHLEQVVDMVTGEEGEDPIFSERTVLFRYDPVAKTWKERGTGTLRILINPTTNRARIVMRRNKILKVCANHLITRDMKLEPFAASQKSIGRTFMWMTLADVSENDAGSSEPKKETFAARFVSIELAEAFKTAFAQAQDGSASYRRPTASASNISEASSESTTPTAQRKAVSRGPSPAPAAKGGNRTTTNVQAQGRTNSPAPPSPSGEPLANNKKATQAATSTARPCSPTATSPTARTLSLPASRDPSPVSQSRLARPPIDSHQETLVFSDRAYCYKYSPSTSKWAVLGRGDVEILQPVAAVASTQLIRIRLLLDPPALVAPAPLATRRVAFNHYILPDIKVSEHGLAAWTWFTPADGESGSPAIVAVRFASVQDSKDFKNKWQECQAWNKAITAGGKQPTAVKVGPCKAAAKAQSRESSPTRSSVLEDRALEKLASDLSSLPPLEGSLLGGAFQPNEHIQKLINNPKSTLRTLLLTLQSKCSTLTRADLIANLKYVSQCCPWIGGSDYLIHRLSTDTATLASAISHVTSTLDASATAISHHILAKIRNKDTILLVATDSDAYGQDAINYALIAAAKARKNLHVIHLSSSAAPTSKSDEATGKQLAKLGVKYTAALNLADLGSVAKSVRLVVVPARRALHDGSVVVESASAKANEQVAAMLKYVNMEAGTEGNKTAVNVLAVCPAVCVSPTDVRFVSVRGGDEAHGARGEWGVPARLITAVVTEQGAVVPQAVGEVFERAVAAAGNAGGKCE